MQTIGQVGGANHGEGGGREIRHKMEGKCSFFAKGPICYYTGKLYMCP